MVTGIREYDKEQEHEFKTNTLTDRASFFLPSEQRQFVHAPGKSLKEAKMDAEWAKNNDPAQKVFSQKFTELKSSDLGLYGKPPRD